MSLDGDGVPAFTQCAPFDLECMAEIEMGCAWATWLTLLQEHPRNGQNFGEEFRNTTPIV